MIPDEDLVSQYYECRQQLDQLTSDFREVITHPTYALPFLQPGRLVKVNHQKLDFGWGVVVNFEKRVPPKNKAGPAPEELPAHEQYIVDVLLNCAPGGSVPKDRTNVTPTPGGIQPCPTGQKGIPLVVPVLLRTLDGISHLRVFMPKDLRQDQARETLWKSVLEVHRRLPKGVPLLDPVENMGIRDDKFRELIKVRVPFHWLVSLANGLHRKLRRWKSACSRARCTGTQGYPRCTRSLRRRWSARRVFVRCGGVFRQRTMYCSLKS